MAILDHDDISLPGRLEKEAAYLDAHPEIGVVSGQVAYFPGNFITNHPEMNLDIKQELTTANVVAHTAAMVRKSVLKEFAIRYEEKYSPAEDYMLCLRLLGCTMFHNIQETLVRYRNFEENTSHLQQEKRPMLMLCADILLSENIRICICGRSICGDIGAYG